MTPFPSPSPVPSARPGDTALPSRRAGRPASRFAATALVATAVALAGCESMSERQRGTAQGAGIGAVAGAVIGKATGGNAGRGAVAGAAVGAVAGNLWSKRMEERRRALAQSTSGTAVTVDRTADDRLKLNVPSDVSFDTGRADIRPEMRTVLDSVAQQIDAGVNVTVVGHTDSTGNDSINDPLSIERANAVRNYLTARGVPSQRISAVGRGAREPVASNDTLAGRAQNRRVEIFLSEAAG